MQPATRVTALTMFPDRRVRAPKTAIVITARTTPYSAMVCPSSRDCSAAKSFCTCFTSLLVLGRRSGAADDERRCEKEDNVPAFLEPLSCLATGKTLKPNSIRSCLGVAAPPMAQLAGSSCLRRAAVIPRPSDCREGFPCSGEWRLRARPDEWVTFRCGSGIPSSGETRADVAASALERDGSKAHATTETSPSKPGHPPRPAVAGRRLPGGAATERARGRAGARRRTVAEALRPPPGRRQPDLRDALLRRRRLLGGRGRPARPGRRGGARGCDRGALRGSRGAVWRRRVRRPPPQRLGCRGLLRGRRLRVSGCVGRRAGCVGG